MIKIVSLVILGSLGYLRKQLGSALVNPNLGQVVVGCDGRFQLIMWSLPT